MTATATRRGGGIRQTVNVTPEDIVTGLRSLGVRSGDLLLAHTSLKSFGRVDGGAEAVAQALIETVAPGGTVFVPTFNYGTLPYDPAVTPSRTGAVTERFWRRPGAVRSGHTTHALAGFGPQADAILKDHEQCHPFGRGSPLWRLWERNGWVLLAGCDHRSNSMIHVAEEAVNAPYLDRSRLGLCLRGSEVVEVAVRRPGCSSGFNVVDEPLRRAGGLREGTIGESKIMLMRAADVVAAARDLLHRDRSALLCGAADCERCTWARERIIEQSRSA